QFSGLGRAHPRAAALIDIRASHPLVQRHRMHTEVLGDLLDRDTYATITSHPDHIVTELLGVRLRHSYILPDRPKASQIRCHQSVQQSHDRGSRTESTSTLQRVL